MTETYRLRVSVDLNPVSPLKYVEHYALITDDSDEYEYVSYQPHYSWDGDLVTPATRTLIDEVLYDGGNVLDELVKHFQRRGYTVLKRAYHDMFNGHITEYVLAVDGPIDVLVKDYEEWLAGDIYVVSLERNTLWTNEYGDTEYRWDYVNSVYNVHLNKDFTPKVGANSEFGISLPDNIEVVYEYER